MNRTISMIFKWTLSSVFCLSRKGWLAPLSFLPFSLVCTQTTSIIKHDGYDSFEAATALFIISYFMPSGLGF
jgi:hypothetical protein